MSHEKLADAAGVHRSTVSRTERELMNPTLYVLHAMASALRLTFSEVANAAERMADD
jgi:DNA-binding XRE family transcriptional regulator